jgi:hypothetical protein
MLGSTMSVAEVGFFLLKVRRIRQQDSKQIDRCRRAVNRTSKSLPDETRKITGVIDMRMREHNCIYGSRIDWRRIPVALAEFFESLE